MKLSSTYISSTAADSKRFVMFGHGFLKVLATVACIILPLTALSAITAVKPAGSGTKTDPFLIDTPGNLKYLQARKSDVWKAGYYFLQTADIDLDGDATFGMIGYPTIPFQGHYDGNGFAIKNYTLNWDTRSTSAADIYYGLFCFINNGATISNLVIENATLSRTKDGKANTGDLKMGILVGGMSPSNEAATADNATRVENIIIRNSRITDYENTEIGSFFIGGVIGDVASKYNGYDIMWDDTFSGIVIRNIYADVDIDLSHTRRSSNSTEAAKYTQANVGGIVGRIRKGRKTDLPANTVYTGTINAPIAMVSPVWGASRASGVSSKAQEYATSMYAGEYMTANKENEIATLSSDADNANRYFSGFFVTHANDSYTDFITFIKEEVTSTAPSGDDCLYGTRTFSANNDTGTFDNASALVMKRFQGVNHATYVESVTSQEVLNMLNAYCADNRGLKLWVAENGDLSFLNSIELETTQTSDFTFQVEVLGIDTNEYTVSWYYPDGTLAKSDAGVTSANPISVLQNDRYYPYFTMTLANSDGVELTSSVFGAKNYDLTITSSDFVNFSLNNDFFDPDNFDLRWVGINMSDGSESVLYNGSGAINCSNTQSVFAREIRVDAYDKYGTLAAQSKPIITSKKLEVDVDIQGGDVCYRAKMKNGNTVIMGQNTAGQYVGMEGYAWLWEVTSDPSVPDSWEGTDLHFWKEDEKDNAMQTYSIHPYNTDRYYRVSWCQLLKDASGNYVMDTDREGNSIYNYRVVMSEVVGPKNIVFVYDKAKNAVGNKFYVEDQFTGIDHNGDAYPDGSDYNTGYDPYHAVKTVKRAYEVLNTKQTLADSKNMADNIVVIMGFYYPDKQKEGYCVWKHKDEKSYTTAATVTGKFNAIDYHGTLNLASGSSSATSLGASTTFSDIVLSGYDSFSDLSDLAKVKQPEYMLYLYANRHDLTFERNVRMLGYRVLASSYGTIKGKDSPDITVVAGSHNYGKEDIPEPDDLKEPGITTMNFFSGCFGRIISSSRNASNVSKTYNIFGTPLKPHRIKVNINIEHNAADHIGQYVPDDYYYSSVNNYHYDIGLITGGQTDGSIYGEIEINFINGYIGRYISGNISFGRDVNADNTTSVKYPSDGFYGSTTLTMQGGEIYELFGGSLGRLEETGNFTEKCEAYFYGRSVINIMGGTIKSHIYGSGAGGVSGFGDSTYYTDDDKVPYYNSDNTLVYGGYDDIMAAGGTDAIAKVLMADGSYLSLDRTISEVNLYGGIIEGNVFGGGYGYSANIEKSKYASSLAGGLFGDGSIRVLPNPVAGKADAVVKGNIYGGGAGTSQYYNMAKKEGLSEAEAFEKYGALAHVYGNSTVELRAGHIYGDVYGAGMGVEGFPDMAVVTGNATVIVDGQRVIVEGNIFGGANLSALKRHQGHTEASASGNTRVEIKHGTIGNNIFGGSAGSPTQTARIDGSTSIEITGGTFINDPYMHTDDGDTERTFNIYGGGYLNSIVEGNTSVYAEKSLLDKEESVLGGDFTKAISDVTFRRFCIYGGGFGEKTCVNGNASVEINIKPDAGVTAPKGEALTQLVSGQTFFDVAGGGYSGNVGYWANASGVPISEIDNPEVADFNQFVNGNVKVVIKGYPFIRKVIGGAFYASVGDTDTHLVSGNVQSIYGGGLMGYVHRSANLTIGSNSDSATASSDNSTLYVVEDVFGGNDVEGVIGTTPWQDDYYTNSDGTPIYSQEADGAPLFTTEIDPTSGKGVELKIYGGTIKGNVYGAGNGHYRGYYVPGWLRYADGPRRQYRKVFLSNASDTDPNNMGDVYKSRPMVGIVKMHIGGNSSTDRVKIGGSVFGGGRSCGIGKFNAILPFEDPRRLAQGGSLQMNFGSHVTVDGNLYLGIQGSEFTSQSGVPADINLATFDGSTTEQLDRLGKTAYDHWYLDRQLGYYVPGFPAPGETDFNLGLTGQHMFRGYMKNIEMNADVELTFYNEPYEGNIRKSWLPIEQAKTMYDAEDVVITNFFTGGQCGSMTNNHLMKASGEQYGGIYRISLTEGLKVLDKVVGGSENAIIHIYPYNASYTEVLDQEEPLYRFEGGMVTQSGIGYDLIIYNDAHKDDDNTIGRDPSEYLNADNADVVTLSDGTEIHRYNYSSDNLCLPTNVDLSTKRYSLAVTNGEGGKIFGYIGAREKRPSSDNTVLKLSVDCTFNPLGENPENHDTHFGGVIYGGCYNSGLMVGDIILNVSSDLIGKHLSDTDESTFGEISSLSHNIGRVFGGGYGEDSSVEGNVYINLLHNFVALNVFGGGCRGNVKGATTINYIGSETESYIYGSLYGGGLSGYVGVQKIGDDSNGWTPRATNVNLYSGNVDKVYGGSCMGHLYGQAKVYAVDEVTSEIPYLDENTLYPSGIHWGGSRLIAGWIYGGNDISGEIHTQYDEENTDHADYKYAAIVNINETPSSETPNSESVGPGKTSPGNVEGYNGFPLIGNLYGGANGNYGVHGDGIYADGEITLASGIGAATVTKSLSGERLPVLSDVLLKIQGGTILNAFGGGNMVTVTGSTTIDVDYSDNNDRASTTEYKAKSRAGFSTEDELNRVWRVMHITSKAQKQEIYSSESGAYVFTYNIHRLFGGNDNADMDIQPTWRLNRAFIGSIYSGGNFGRMTHFKQYETTDKNDNNEDVNTLHQEGIYLGISSRNLRATNVYGGGRVGDIDPAVPVGTVLNDNFYGATLEITDGVIDHVYGGNDVSGFVYKGANVKIHGAISGDVYCAGNGNHLFQYDQTGTLKKIEECYDDDMGGRYFKLPAVEGLTNSAADIIRAINSYRPNIDRAFMDISGTGSDNIAYVRGNVYCGGNSATVIKQADSNPDIIFNIGSYVVLNGVFLGSNGENLTNGEMMRLTENLNKIDLRDNGTSELLDIYMDAVAVEAVPKDFNLDPGLEEAYIGNFFVGGNNGSMLTTETINLTFPECLTVFGKIVGGSQNANLTYKEITHIGGLTGEIEGEKVHLTIKNKFEPWRLVYPLNHDDREIKLEADVIDIEGKMYFPVGKCSVYGGCYTSGVTIGGIGIDVYSDMMAEYDPSSEIGVALAQKGVSAGMTKKRMVANGINDLTRRAYAVVGGGYGANTQVRGDVHVRMLPTLQAAANKPALAASSTLASHPSVGTLFGGSELGGIVGNTFVEIRDGQVFSNLYAASESAPMYGSTQTIIGYPDYYICNTPGKYKLLRTDNLSRGAAGGDLSVDEDGLPTIKTEIALRNGDILSKNLYDAIEKSDGQLSLTDGSTVAAAEAFTFIENDQPANWDDIDISIGYGGLVGHEGDYYGFGNVYGGGFISASSSVSLAGKYTVCKFTDEYTPDAESVGYGGNSMILVWDNKDNATAPEASIRDHISIGTGHYVPVSLKAGQNANGKYLLQEGKYIPQGAEIVESAVAVSDNKYFEVESDGGIYGGGRKVFVEGFKNCDIAYYGYADFTPQSPKLINTFQRFDLLTVTDCCLLLQGATDFATGKLDATKYSLTRIGELSMISSLPSDQPFYPGEAKGGAFRNLQHDKKRTRNYMAFLNDVHYLAAVTSNQLFTDPLHGADGQINTFGDYSGSPTSLNTTESTSYTYKSYKQKRINDYYSDSEPTTDASIGFDQRNLATAKNMLGISNGYVLNIQSGVTKGGVEEIYYGPVNGVFEVKLMTLAPNEGGGYVYALNHHDDPDHFLETTGNFVFPGASHTKTAKDSEVTTYNYVYDDCFPMDLGWDHYKPKGDCNELQEIHYWYVDGDEFYYNVTLTAYTSTSTDNKFTLNNNEQIIYLRGVSESENPTLKVSRVIWTESDNTDSDIQNVGLDSNNPSAYEKDYRLYISVDGNPQSVHTTEDHTQPAFVAPVPRADFDAASASDCSDVLVSQSSTVSNFKDNVGDEKNLPLAGITLVDRVDNSTRPYFDEHMKEPEHVTIELTNEDNGRKYKYVINLTIKYLLGPTITGLPEIENCALPGEYIFANSFGVTVDLDDETMAVNSRNWYAVSDEIDLTADNADIPSVIAAINAGTGKGINLENQKFDDDRQVHIPAYLYLDGWHLVYEIVANGQPFYLRADAEGYDEAFTSHGHKQLTVHNYHRMRPWDGTSIDALGQPDCEDLKIVGGARIYIEDDEDMAYFYTWLANCQNEPDNHTEEGQPINPQYGADIMVMLMKDVKLPADAPADALRFDGVFHGNGHNISLNGNKMMLGTNKGAFYNTGFVAETGKDLTVFGDNAGLIENCFLYTLDKKGLMDGNDNPTNIINSYRTSDLSEAQQLGGLMRATLSEFEYGQIAYNLNLFYLQGRYDRGNNFNEITDDVLSPLRDIYHNGDFRFALWTDVDNPDALRTHPIPNYRNYQGKRTGVNIDNYGPVTGRDATNHNIAEEMSTESEHVVVDEATDEILYYHPVYPKDYLFFGQDLNYDSDEAAYPHTISLTNRVYRSSGFYGSMVDRGFHFNIDAQAVQPTLTAVDFTGVRDAEHHNTYADDEVVRKNSSDDIDQICFYPPMLDLPTQGVKSFTTSTKKMGGCDDTDTHVTRNILIYVDKDDDIYDSFAYASTDPEDDIFGHLIYPVFDPETSVVRTDTKPTTPLLHLVDYEDFNCPISLTVTDRTWYERNPEIFSSGNNAWDGLCIPFTVKKVEGVISDPMANPIRSHGELSHFYGPHVGVDNEEPSHEYWLRKFTAVGSGKLLFDRPSSEDDVLYNPTIQEEKHLYHFSNTYNSAAFGNIYGDGTTHARPQYTPEGVDYVDYPMITREIPYIVSFPGRRFYEFDLSGQFYAEKFPGTSAIPQRLIFSTEGSNDIAVTDYSEIKTFTHDGVSLTGTYMHKQVEVGEGYISAISGDKADHFEQQAVGSIIRPFRIYAATAGPVITPLPIRSRAIDNIGEGTDDDEPCESLTYTIDYSVLVVESPFEDIITLPLYDIEGRLVRYLDIHEGENRFTGIAPGYYVVDDFKFAI